MDNIGTIAVSIILGCGAAFLVVQNILFFASIVIGVMGFARSRRFDMKYFLLFLKSLVGIAVCVLFFLVGDYIFRDKLGYSYQALDMFIFWGMLGLTLAGFIFHVLRKFKRTLDVVATPEFDAFHSVSTSSQGIDDYVKNNLELLRVLHDERTQ